MAQFWRRIFEFCIKSATTSPPARSQTRELTLQRLLSIPRLRQGTSAIRSGEEALNGLGRLRTDLRTGINASAKNVAAAVQLAT
jgi:hypothetical protein